MPVGKAVGFGAVGLEMATRDLTRRFAELRVLQHGVEGSENKRPGDAFSESGLLDVSGPSCGCLFATSDAVREVLVCPTRALFFSQLL